MSLSSLARFSLSYQKICFKKKRQKNKILPIVMLSAHFLFFVFLVEDMDSYLHYVGGSTGIIAIGIAAASAIYFATRPKPEKPLVPLHDQAPILEVSNLGLMVYLKVDHPDCHDNVYETMSENREKKAFRDKTFWK